MLHARPGQQRCNDAVFSSTWGPGWRDRFDLVQDWTQWTNGKADFVKNACKALGLPLPTPVAHDRCIPGILSSTPKGNHWDIACIPMPLVLKRDSLWKKGLSRPQLEFVVDNQVLAEVANGKSSVSNEWYRLALDRIRTRLRHLFDAFFEYKGGFLEPVDWRPRECNKVADHVANCVLHHETSFQSLSADCISKRVSKAVGVQVYTDGGLQSGRGSTGIVIMIVDDMGAELKSEIVGYAGQHFHPAHTSCQTEVSALDWATEYFTLLCRDNFDGFR